MGEMSIAGRMLNTTQHNGRRAGQMGFVLMKIGEKKRGKEKGWEENKKKNKGMGSLAAETIPQHNSLTDNP